MTTLLDKKRSVASQNRIKASHGDLTRKRSFQSNGRGSVFNQVDHEHDGQEYDDDGEQHGGVEDFVGHQISNLLLADHAATGELF
jgi:hypothetical protein